MNRPHQDIQVKSHIPHGGRVMRKLLPGLLLLAAAWAVAGMQPKLKIDPRFGQK